MVEVLDGLVRLGCKVVHLTGGEPLLWPDWARLAQAAAARGIRVGLITNGTLLTRPMLKMAREVQIAAIAVSVDGLQPTHDALRPRHGTGGSPWEAAMDAITRSVSYVDTYVITQVNRLTFPDLPALLPLLVRKGVLRWQLQLTIPVGRALTAEKPLLLSPRDLEPLVAFIANNNRDPSRMRIDASDTIGYYGPHEPDIRRSLLGPGMWMGCRAGIDLVAITFDGKVRGCSALPADFDAGDLHEESIEMIWQDRDRFIPSCAFDPARLTGRCARCSHGALCRAGCTTMAYWTTGTIYENPYCLQTLSEDGV